MNKLDDVRSIPLLIRTSTLRPSGLGVSLLHSAEQDPVREGFNQIRGAPVLLHHTRHDLSSRCTRPWVYLEVLGAPCSVVLAPILYSVQRDLVGTIRRCFIRSKAEAAIGRVMEMVDPRMLEVWCVRQRSPLTARWNGERAGRRQIGLHEGGIRLRKPLKL